MAAYEYLTPHWHTVTGHAWPLTFSSAHYPVWLACGIAGSFLYSRWLIWKCHDYPEQLTVYLCFWGSYLGAVALTLGVWYVIRRWREKAAWEASVALTPLPPASFPEWEWHGRFGPHDKGSVHAIH